MEGEDISLSSPMAVKVESGFTMTLLSFSGEQTIGLLM
jgi:hypothetical protein